MSWDMKNNKSRKNGAKVRTPVNKLQGKETIEHYNDILLEDMNKKFDIILEATISTKETLEKKIDNLNKRMDQKFEVVEWAIPEHSKQIKGLGCEVKKHGEAILRVEQKVDKIAVSVESHETRLTVVKEKMESHLAVHP